MSHFPKSWKKSSKPHKFCPGCGQALAMKILAQAIDELEIQNKTVYGCDIGCSLLSWDMFDIDTIQTHHGRVIPAMVGFKLAKPESVAIAWMGDGGGYAIGAQHLVNAAMRNNKITAILINNANYAMTGGQFAPTTLLEQKTETTPDGRKEELFGDPIHGPEMIRQIAAENAYIARGICSDPIMLKNIFKKALQNQIENKGFSFVEVLSSCPVNWKMSAVEAFNYTEQELAKIYPLGEIVKNG